MSIFGRFSAGGGMVPQRTSPIRPGAEEYAFSLGLTPGGPGWGDAIREYVLNGSPDRVGGSPSGAEQGGEFRPRPSGARTDRRHPPVRGRDAVQVSQAAEEFANGVNAIRHPREPGPDLSFREDDPKHMDWPALIEPVSPRSFPPKRRPDGSEPDLQKRHFTTAPRHMDSERVRQRMAEAIGRLPEERRQFSQLDHITVPPSPLIDRYYSAILAREGVMRPDGSFMPSPDGAIGPAQIMPGTAPGIARELGITLDNERYRRDRAYNEMLGLAHYQDLVRQFGGDYVKAAAAYNWVPKKTEQAIRAAERAGEPHNWEKYLPGETQKYVTFFRKYNRLQED